MTFALTTQATLDLAGQLCSRLCHDMSNPVGALANGLELLAEETDPEMRRRCLELVEQSARISADKLKFFRLAFGGGGSPGEQLALAEARAAVEALPAARGAITVNWAITAEALPRAAVKTLLNFALIGCEALVRGGTLDLGAEAGGHGTEVVVRAAGTRIAFLPEIGRALEGALAGSELSSRTAPAAMVHQLAESLGGRVRYALGEDALVLGADLPAAA